MLLPHSGQAGELARYHGCGCGVDAWRREDATFGMGSLVGRGRNIASSSPSKKWNLCLFYGIEVSIHDSCFRSIRYAPIPECPAFFTVLFPAHQSPTTNSSRKMSPKLLSSPNTHFSPNLPSIFFFSLSLNSLTSSFVASYLALT